MYNYLFCTHQYSYTVGVLIYSMTCFIYCIRVNTETGDHISTHHRKGREVNECSLERTMKLLLYKQIRNFCHVIKTCMFGSRCSARLATCSKGRREYGPENQRESKNKMTDRLCTTYLKVPQIFYCFLKNPGPLNHKKQISAA